MDPSSFLATLHPAPQPSCLHPLDRSSFHIFFTLLLLFILLAFFLLCILLFFPPQTSSFLAAPRYHPPHPTFQLTWILQLPLRSLQPSSSYSTSASSTSSYEPFFFLSGHPSPSSSLYSSSSASSISSSASSSSFLFIFLLILFVFILLVHPLSSSSSSLLCIPSSVTFLSPLLPLSLLSHLRPPHSLSIPPFLPSLDFIPVTLSSASFLALPPYSLLSPSSSDPELPPVLTLSSSSS